RDMFEAKQDQIDVSSEAMVLHADWVEAVIAFMDRDTVEVMLLPPGNRELWINSDPERRKAILEAARRARNIEALEQRDRRRREEQTRIDTRQRMLDGG